MNIGKNTPSRKQLKPFFFSKENQNSNLHIQPNKAVNVEKEVKSLQHKLVSLPQSLLSTPYKPRDLDPSNESSEYVPSFVCGKPVKPFKRNLRDNLKLLGNLQANSGLEKGQFKSKERIRQPQEEEEEKQSGVTFEAAKYKKFPQKRFYSNPISEDEGSVGCRSGETRSSDNGSASKIVFGTSKLSDYTNLGQLGKGTYGEVRKYKHKQSNQIVAIKKFLYDENSSEGTHFSTQRELSILQSLSDHDCFVKLLDIITENSFSGQPSTYAVFEYYPHTLSKLIDYPQKHNNILQPAKIKKIMRQLLQAMDILHSKMILHRDIKPDNILLDDKGNVKICDFGLAKKVTFHQRRKSNTIVSLWYRAPEIILGAEEYFIGVDMWSVGCIFAELYLGRALFAHQDDDAMIRHIFHVLGNPEYNNVGQIYSEYKYYPRYKSIRPNVPQPLSSQFPMMNKNAIDLLKSLLDLDPNKRLNARQALSHPYFQEDIIQQKEFSFLDENSLHIGL